MAHPHLPEVLFFPDDAAGHKLQTFLHFLGSAQHTMDICVFNITDNRIAHVIEAAHRRGVKVRIISDDDQAMSLGSDIVELNKHGIPVATDNTKAHMHHKYCVIDGRLLLTGSFNWTRSASLENRENIIITADAELVKKFDANFAGTWKEFTTSSHRNPVLKYY
eukprot:TRINITY_DN512_c0_g1_i2.p1 TRINITY_DN512_c0_g1~~TRINITY_DN512_c0_g1_i2.p1  ORF type:complete len:164 (-),score=37.25 TRINITY_DN512_c0_g1_i2:43-534(-)